MYKQRYQRDTKQANMYIETFMCDRVAMHVSTARTVISICKK